MIRCHLGVAVIVLIGCGKVTPVAVDAFVPDVQTTPLVATLMPASGIVSTPITITGVAFGDVPGTVTVGGVTATIQAWTSTSITAAVPDVMPGSVDVVVTTSLASSAPQPFRVVLPPTVYLNNDANAADGFNTVTALAFDPSTGALTQGAIVSLGVASTGYGGCSTSVIVHEHTRHLFASGRTAVAVFDIDPITGALTAVAGSPFATSTTQSYGLAVNAAGTRLWLADTGLHVAVLDVAANGTLTPVAGSPFATPNNIDTIALSMDESFIFANSEASFLLAYEAASTGALTAVAGSPFTTPGFDFAMVRRPTADQLFIPQGSTVEVWQVTNGIPAQISGSPFPNTVPAGSLHHSAFTSDGNRAYIDTYSSGYVFGFSLAANGTPTALAGSPWNFTSSLTTLSCIAVSRDNAYLIAPDENNKRVGVFSLATDGTPTPVANSPFSQTTPFESASGLAITF